MHLCVLAGTSVLVCTINSTRCTVVHFQMKPQNVKVRTTKLLDHEIVVWIFDRADAGIAVLSCPDLGGGGPRQDWFTSGYEFSRADCPDTL